MAEHPQIYCGHDLWGWRNRKVLPGNTLKSVLIVSMSGWLISACKWPGALSLWVYLVLNADQWFSLFAKNNAVLFMELMLSSYFFGYLDIRTTLLFFSFFLFSLYFICKLFIIMIKIISGLKRVLLLIVTILIFTIFSSYLIKCSLHLLIYYRGVFCKVNILVAFCTMDMMIGNYLNVLTQEINLERSSQKPLLLK